MFHREPLLFKFLGIAIPMDTTTSSPSPTVKSVIRTHKRTGKAAIITSAMQYDVREREMKPNELHLS